MFTAFWLAVAGTAVFVATCAIAAGQSVLDLNFDDLGDAVQEHSFLAVTFYSPGCGHCRRLLPSWTQAAELLKDQQAPIQLARMDITSRGGMRAWKAFGLERVPAVKVFVGNSVEEPLSYKGHLDAGGIAAHLAMLQRVECVVHGSPKARRMLEEVRKAAPFLEDSRPPAKVVRVDFSYAANGGKDGEPYRNSGPNVADTAKREFARETGMQLGDAAELRIFLDGRPWVDGGVFMGMPTADGIRRHMEWVSVEAGLPPPQERNAQEYAPAGGEEVASCTATEDGSVNFADIPCALACTSATEPCNC